MNIRIFFILVLVIGLPIAWFLAEFRSRRRHIRLTLGILALLSTFSVAVLIGILSTLNYNTWYGNATSELLATTINQIEDGRLNRVMKVLRGLHHQYQPSLNSRTNYRTLVSEAVSRMRGEVPIHPDSAWDAEPFNQTTWSGHWENNAGLWLIIDASIKPCQIQHLKSPSTHSDNGITSVSISSDYRSLTIEMGRKYSHKLTLVNKYEARHECYHLEKNRPLLIDTFHKLIRATPEQRQMTQQPPSDDTGNSTPPTTQQL